ALEIGGRQVHAPASEIPRHVAQDVRELERDAEIDGVLPRSGVGAAEDPHAHEADGGSDPDAVFVQLLERTVAPPVQIHFDALDQRIERGPRQPERPDDWLQRAPLRRRRRSAIETPRDLLPPAPHLRPPPLRRPLAPPPLAPPPQAPHPPHP